MSEIVYTKKRKLLVAIPCFNEAVTISQLIQDVPRVISDILHVDVLVVDDGSIDNTHSAALDAGAKVLRHTRNLGVGKAFQTALSFAIENGYDLMISIDGDRQFNPLDIPRLVKPVIDGKADMVTGSRFISSELTPDMPRAKLIGNHIMSYLISQLVRQKYYDVSCGFRCYSREALLQLNLHGAFTYTQETFLGLAAKQLVIEEVPIEAVYFSDRKSRVAGSLTGYAVNTVKIIFKSYRDYFPLRFCWGIAMLFAIPAVALALLFFGHYFITGVFSGYLFAGFSSAFFVVMALVFFVLGIVMDMLGRIRSNQDRILYYIKKNGDFI